VHDLHIWAISSADLALSAHLEVDETALAEPAALLAAVKQMLAQEFGIGHVTLELEIAGGECAGSTCVLVPRLPERMDGDHLGHQH